MKKKEQSVFYSDVANTMGLSELLHAPVLALMSACVQGESE